MERIKIQTLSTAATTRDLTSGSSGQITITSSSELMKNHAGISAIDSQHKIKAIEDSTGEPIVFSVGNDDQLYMIIRDADNRGQWKQANLSASFGDKATVTAFEVSQSQDGRFLLFVAVSYADNPNKHKVYLTRYFSNDLSQTNWANIGSEWTERYFEGTTAKVSKIFMGTDDDKLGAPMCLVVINDGHFDNHYLLNTDLTNKAWGWKMYKIPENAKKIIDLAVGTVFKARGVYALYETIGGQSLTFTSLPDPVYGKTSSYDFPLTGNANCITALPTGGRSDDLYVGGDGISVFVGSKSVATPVFGADLARDIQEIVLRQDSQTISLWALTNEKVLFHADCLKTFGAQWGFPFPLQNRVMHIAPFRNSQKLTSELMIVTDDNTLYYLYQSPESTLWHQNNIGLPNIDKYLEYNSYTMTVTLKDDKSNPISMKNVEVSASTSTYTEINGITYHLDPHNSVAVPTDIFGKLTFVQRVTSISSPSFYIKGENFAQQVEINPANTIQQKLQKIQSKEDLKNVTLKDGSKLVTKDLDDISLDHAAKAIGKMAELATTAQHSDAQETRSLRTRSLQANRENLIAFRELSDDYLWGMKVSNGRIELVEGAGAMGQLFPQTVGSRDLLSDFSNDIAVNAGNFLHWIESGIDWLGEKLTGIGNFILQKLEEGVKMLIQIGEKVFSFLIETAEMAFRFINAFLKDVLGIDLEKILQWLGFLFEWDDIRHTHNVLVNMFNQTLNYSRDQVNTLADEVEGMFESAKVSIRSLAPRPEWNEPMKAQQKKQLDSAPDSAKNKSQDAQNSSSAGWANYHLTNHAGSSNFNISNLVPEPFQLFWKDVVQPTAESIQNTVSTLGTDLTELFNSDGTSINDILAKLGVDILLGLVDAIEKIVVGMIRLVADMIDYIKNQLNEKIDIPILSALYKEVSGNDLSVLDLLMLVAAIPVTIVYKIVANEAPFRRAGDELFLSNDYKHIFAVLKGEASPQTRSLSTQIGMSEMPITTRGELGGEQEDPQSSPEKVYSYIGGFVSFFTGIANDAITIFCILTELDEVEKVKKEHTLEKLGWVTFGLSLGTQILTFPIGKDKEVSYQRWAWGVDFGWNILERILTKCQCPKQLTAGLGIVKGIGVFVLEYIIYDIEMHKSEEHKSEKELAADKESDMIKFAQSCGTMVKEVAEGVLAIGGKSVYVKAFAGSFAILGALGSAVANIARGVINSTNKVEYQAH